MSHYSETEIEYLERMIKMHVLQGNCNKSDSLLVRYSERLSPQELSDLKLFYSKVKKEAEMARIQKIRDSITHLLNEFDFKKAETIREESGILDDEWYAAAVIKAKEGYRQHGMQKIEKVLSHFDFRAAEQLRSEYAIPENGWYENQLRQAEALRLKKTQKHNFITLLRKRLEASLFEAEQAFQSQDVISRSEFESLKHRWVNAYFLNTTPFPFSESQASAITTILHNTLLQARAGAGKTSVVAARVALLIGHEHVHPDKVMALAFNKKAAKELTTRIRKQFGVNEFSNSRTFHSLAYQIVQPKKNLLFDEKEGGLSQRKQSQFIQKLINDRMNPVLKKELFELFRKEAKELETIGEFLSPSEYLHYRRNRRHLTLRGDLVKSAGEKYIGDFLFEHGIKHRYEALWYWKNDGNYRPDFTLFGPSNHSNIVIEHWGIDERDLSKKTPDHWNVSWSEYYRQIQEKRQHWQDYNRKHQEQPITLIETSVRDLSEGRERFESILRSRLNDAGVRLGRLGENEIYDRLDRVHLARITTMFTRFITLAQKQRLSPSDIQQRIDSGPEREESEQLFITLANSMFAAYRKRLATSNSTDFDGLLESAIQKVEESRGTCGIRTLNDRVCRLCDLHHILVDEYQDFSLLFQKLIDSIRRNSPSLKLFCVGDDWQAINGFAGSDIKYFNNFEKMVEDSSRLQLLSNFRSAKTVVKASNEFMKGKGSASDPESVVIGSIYVCHTNKIFIEQRKDEEFERERKRDEVFSTFTLDKGKRRNRDHGLVIGRILKACNRIVHDALKAGKTVGIMSRTRNLSAYYRDLSTFQEKLKSTFSDQHVKKGFDELVSIGTTHSFKGLEADIVIMLQVNEGKYPFLHPDDELFSLLGVTPQKVLGEEQRLFYVGLTRAKEKLFLLTEEGKESDYIKKLRMAPGVNLLEFVC